MSALPARFWDKVSKDADGCWRWTGPKVRNGYGQCYYNGRNRLAHRITYEALRGAVDGYQLDHTCFTRECVNPEHLRPVTNKQNGEHRSGAQANSLTGARGVRLTKSGRYQARIRHHGRRIHLGTYATTEEAAAAWRAKADELFTHHHTAAA